MRLGQLARQIGVSPKEILRILNDDFNTEIKAHPNAKIPDELIDNITRSLIVDNTNETEQENTLNEVDSIEQEPNKIEQIISIVEGIKVNNNATEDSKTSVEIELPLGKIKTEIPTLEGPKIIGKIELSEIELRRIAERNAERLEKLERPVRTKRPKRRPIEDKKTKPKRKLNDSLEDKRKRELKEIEAKRKKTAESLKKLNKKKYEEKSKSKPVIVSKKKKKKKKTEEIAKQNNEVKSIKKKPTSVMGKLWGWLNDA